MITVLILDKLTDIHASVINETDISFSYMLKPKNVSYPLRAM